MVGQDRKVHIDSVTRTCAYATLVDDKKPAAEQEQQRGGDGDIDVPKRQDWSVNRGEGS